MTRDRTADVLRGFAIAMVVLGHSLLAHGPGTPERNPLMLILAALEMPLFAFVSGYVVFGRVGRPRYAWLGRKASQLLVPYFVWWALFWFIGALPTAVLIGLESTRRGGFLAYMWAVVAEPRLGLWYLWVLFGCYLVLSALLPARRFGRLAVVVGGAILLELVFIAVHVAGARGTFGIPMVLEYWPFLIAGYFVRESRGELSYQRLSWAWLLLAYPLLYAGITAAFGYRGYLIGTTGPTVLANLAIRWIAGFLGIAFAVALVQLIPLGVVGRCLSVLGRLSIGVYATHFLFLDVGFGDGALRVVSSFVAALTLSTLLTLVLRRIPVIRGLLLGMWSVGKDGSPPSLGDSVYATSAS